MLFHAWSLSHILPSPTLLPQIATDKGPRDLRMRCVGGSQAVKAILEDLSGTGQVGGGQWSGGGRGGSIEWSIYGLTD